MAPRTQEVYGSAEKDRRSAAGRGGAGHLFGIPMGEFGWFASLLMGAATGFAAFFAATFVGIVGVMVYNSSGHQAMDYAWSYTRLGLPVGLVVLAVAWGYLGTMWVRRVVGRR